MFSLVSVRGLYCINQYNSSISTTSGVGLGAGFSLWLAFFYPIHHIGFIHMQNFSNTSTADSAIVHLQSQFSGFFWICVFLRVYCIVFAALLTFAALAPRTIISRAHLIFSFSTYRAFLPCLYCHLFHMSILTLYLLFGHSQIASCSGTWYNKQRKSEKIRFSAQSIRLAVILSPNLT